MRSMPLVPVALAIGIGIAVAHLGTGLPTGAWVAFMAAATLVGGLLLVCGYRRRDSVLTGLFLAVAFAAGGMRCLVDEPARDPLHWSHLCSGHDHLEVRLTETPVPGERSYRARAKVERVEGREARGHLRLYLRKDPSAEALRYGDRLMLHAWPDTLRMSLYTTGDHYIVIARDNTSRRARIEAFRMRLLHRMQAGPLPAREAAVAEALTLGWRADIDPTTRDAFRDAGIAHLLAVSGLHVGLLASIVGGLLFWTGKERRGRTIRGSAQLVAVWGFALVTGLSPSAMRAALMFSLLIASRILARRTRAMNLLAASAIITLMGSPALLWDTGWQLSYAAVAGILLASPAIRRYRNPVWQSAAVSMAATLATTPITVATFHRLHPYFLIANVVIVPLAGLMLVLSLAYMAAPYAATAGPLEWLLRLTETFVGDIARLPGAVIETQ